MKDKVKLGTEKYPTKRGYAIGKLQKFLKLTNLTKKFTINCKQQHSEKGNNEIDTAFMWREAYEGERFWIQVNKDFNHFLKTGKVFTIYGD